MQRDHAGGSHTPTARARSATRVETPKIAGRYQSYFRLHKWYGDDDQLLNVVVVIVRPPPKSSMGVGSQCDEKQHEFDSEASAYEFMDYRLKGVPSSSARLPPFQHAPQLGGALFTPQSSSLCHYI